MELQIKKQLQEVTLKDIKNVIKEKMPEMFDKMILSDSFKRRDFYFVRYKYQKIERNLYHINLPLLSSLERSLNSVVSKEVVYDDKTELTELPLLKESILSHSEKKNVENSDIKLDYPIKVEQDKVLENQGFYVLKNTIKIKTCNECDGDKYITCKDSTCQGQHEWECGRCIGEGKVSCSKCGGEGWVKCGGFLSGCGGKGTVEESYTVNNERRTRRVKCSKCSGKGKVVCSNCNAQGKVICSKCSGRRKIVCTKCYGDNKRYGLIDCPVCLAQGKLFEYEFVQSTIKNDVLQEMFTNGDEIPINDKDVEKYFEKLPIKEQVFSQHNKIIIENYNEYSEDLTQKIRTKHNLFKINFPKLLQEEVSYVLIPYIEFSYKHILTNKTYSGVIKNFWETPKIELYTNPEEVKQSLKNVGKSTKKFFSKLFKTKNYLKKEDKKTEIKLLIYLAKADNKIEEEEKVYLSEKIQSVDSFTNSEKKKLFKLMDLSELPELTEKDITFSSNEVAEKIINQLEELSKADGEIEEAEKRFIATVRQIVFKEDIKVNELQVKNEIIKELTVQEKINNEILKQDNAIVDGIINEEKYNNSKMKILWVLTEPETNDLKNTYQEYFSISQIEKNIDEMLSLPTIQNIMYSTYGLYYNIDYNDMPYNTEKEVYGLMEEIALINIKKQVSENKSNNNELKEIYLKNEKLLLEQIQQYEPNIIIFGGTLNYFNPKKLKEIGWDIEENKKIVDKKTNNTYYYPISKDKLVIYSYHPNSFAKNKSIFCSEIIEAGKLWKEM